MTMTSLIYMLLHFPISFPANYILEKYGVKVGVNIAAGLCLFGSWLRCLLNYSFSFALIG